MLGGSAVGERNPVGAQYAQVAGERLQAAPVSRGADDRIGPKAAPIGQHDLRAVQPGHLGDDLGPPLFERRDEPSSMAGLRNRR